MEYRNAYCYIKIDRYILLYFNSLGLCSRIEKDKKEEVPRTSGQWCNFSLHGSGCSFVFSEEGSRRTNRFLIEALYSDLF